MVVFVVLVVFPNQTITLCGFCVVFYVLYVFSQIGKLDREKHSLLEIGLHREFTTFLLGEPTMEGELNVSREMLQIVSIIRSWILVYIRKPTNLSILVFCISFLH